MRITVIQLHTNTHAHTNTDTHTDTDIQKHIQI